MSESTDSNVAEMSDEQYGRAWAKMMDKAPHVRGPSYGLLWHCERDKTEHEDSVCLPEIVWVELVQCNFKSEAEAYAELGRAVREVHKQVPTLKGE